MVKARIRPVAPADQRGEPIEIEPAHESRGRFDELLIDGIDVTRCRPAQPALGRADEAVFRPNEKMLQHRPAQPGIEDRPKLLPIANTRPDVIPDGWHSEGPVWHAAHVGDNYGNTDHAWL